MPVLSSHPSAPAPIVAQRGSLALACRNHVELLKSAVLDMHAHTQLCFFLTVSHFFTFHPQGSPLYIAMQT